MITIDRTLINNAITDWNQKHPTKSFIQSQTEAKTSLLAAKVFLASEGNQVRFIELNFLQRFLRVAFGLYSATIFKKQEREKIQTIIKECLNPPTNPTPCPSDFKKREPSLNKKEVHPSANVVTPNPALSLVNIFSPPIQSTPLETFSENFYKRIEAASTTTELNLIKSDLKKEIELKELNFKRNSREIENLHILYATAQSRLSKISGEKYQEDRIPEELLEPTFDMAKYGKENDMEKVKGTWILFHKFLNSSKNEAIRNVNLALAKEILLYLRVDYEEIKNKMEKDIPKQASVSSRPSVNIFKIPCLGISLPDAAIQEVETELSRMTNRFNSLQANGETWNHILTYQQALDDLEKECNELQKKVMQDRRVVAKLETQVRSELLLMGGDLSLVEQYVNPPNRDVKLNRLFSHTALNSNDSVFKHFKETLNQFSQLQPPKLMSKIQKEYKTIPNAGGGDCFFHSCAQQLGQRIGIDLTDTEVRANVANELKKDKETYESLYNTRKKDDDLLHSVNTYEEYCEWIAGKTHWGSGPELRAISILFRIPVILIHRQQYGDLCIVINPQFNAEPLLFNLNSGHYTAYQKK